MMRTPSKILAATAFAVAVPLAGPVAAAPLSQSLTLGNTDAGMIEQVQWRRWDDGYYAYGAAPHGYAYGVAPDAYYAYGAAPGYRVAPRYRQWNFGNGSAATAPGSHPLCPADLESASGYPSWMCR
jgi:hypothetical protein